MSRQNELFGKKCRDRLTGFVGVCTERVIWLFGCDKYALRQIADDSREYKTLPRVFNEQSLEVLESIVEIDPNMDDMCNQKKFFGKLCQDKITGFKGICTGRTTYLYGSDMYCLTPKSKKKNIARHSEWFDEGRLEIIGDGIPVDDVNAEKPGGMDSYPDLSLTYAPL